MTKKISLLFLCSTLFSCALVDTEQKKPISAEDLAMDELAAEQQSKKQSTQTITELPEPKPVSLQDVNQLGHLPAIATLSDETGKNFKLPPGVPINLDFEQVELRQVIEIIADTLGLNVVIDPTIGDKITLRTSDKKPLQREDLWPLLQLLLNNAKVTIEKKGGVYHFKKVQTDIPGSIASSSAADALTSSDASEVLQITPLRYVSIDSALTALKPLVEPEGRIISLSMLNIIGIIASPQKLERVNQLINLIDTDPFIHRGMRLFRLVNSKAAEVQTELDKILKAVAGDIPAYHIVSLERINAILVVAPPNTGFNEVATWIDILDETSEESGEQVFIYRVKNLEAKELAATLTEVFKTDGKKDEDLPKRDKKEDAKPDEPPATPSPDAPLPSPTSPGGGMAVSAELKVNIVADESTNSLIIKAIPRDYRQLLETIYALDRIPKEVMVNVVIAEVTLNKSNKFGIDWQSFFGSDRGEGRAFIGTNFGIRAAANPSGFVVKQVAGRLNSMLNLIATNNDLRVLSRPSILVRNNEEASINVGSDEPTISQVNNSTINNTQFSSSVQYRNTGITLKVTPRINDDGIVNLKVSQEISQVGPERTTQSLPSFIQRKVETSLVVYDGSAIVMGGLIETTDKYGQQGIPGLKDVPVFGNLFSATSDEENRTELILIILPEIVDPETDNLRVMQSFRKKMQAISVLLNEQHLLLETN
jgi:general secretion pathway protein D